MARHFEFAFLDGDFKIAAAQTAQLDLDDQLTQAGNEDVGVRNPKGLTAGSETHM
jgi:hypothetical protein